jgi:hypothetical protein
VAAGQAFARSEALEPVDRSGDGEPAVCLNTKLERNLQRDREDFVYLAETVPLDLSILKERYTEEMRTYLGRPEREDLTLQLWIDIVEERRKS